VVLRLMGRPSQVPARRAALVTALIGATLLVDAATHVVLALTLETTTFLAVHREVGWGILGAGLATLSPRSTGCSERMIGLCDLRDLSCCVHLRPKLLYLMAKTLASLPPHLSMAASRFRESVLALLDLLAQPLLLFSPSGVDFSQPRLPCIQELSDTLLGSHWFMHSLFSSLLPNGGAKARPRTLPAGAERDPDLLPASAVFDSLLSQCVLPVGERSMNLVTRGQGGERRVGRQSLPSFHKFRRDLPRRQPTWTRLVRISGFVNPG
jgi:hypothetical protein